MPWAVAAAGVAAAGSVAGSAIQSSATKSAQSSANAAQAAAEERARADLAPYNTAGQHALTATQDAAGLNGQPGYDAAMAGFHTSPGYQFSLDQGLRAVDAGAAASGLLRSGAAIKAEQTFGTGLADQDFTNYYNRLYNLSNLGENAAAKTGANAVTTGSGIAQTDASAGQQMSSIYGNEAKSLGGTVNTLFNNPAFQKTASGWFGSGNSTGVSGSPTTPSIYGVPSPY
jgi:hypothetical protein